jgi:hypothetical protein
MTLLRLAARAMRGLMLHQLGFDIAPERRRLENAQAAAAITSASGRRSMLCIQEEPTEVMRPNARDQTLDQAFGLPSTLERVRAATMYHARWSDGTVGL